MALERDFGDINEARICRLKYETFVSNPETELARILSFLGISASEATIESAVQGVSTTGAGNWRTALDEATLANIPPIMNDTLKAFGYE